MQLQTSSPEPTLLEQLTRIQLEWQLKSEQMATLLHVSVSEYESWLKPESPQRRSTATIPPGMLCAVPLVSIYRNLARKLPDPTKQVEWLFQPHPDFGKTRPIDVISSSRENQAWVSYYLDSALRASS